MTATARTCRGIYREVGHSPGRVEDDRAIMECVSEALVSRGFAVDLIDADAEFDTHCANMFVMCERAGILDRLVDAQNTGSIVVNSPSAIRNTYRHRMIELFARHHVSAPVSQVFASNANSSRPAAAVWIKRYDFHATQPSDVIYVASDAGWHEALDRFARRGIPFIVAQDHVAGDLVKFYGVGGHTGESRPSWFQWFYHRDQKLSRFAFDPNALASAATRAADALGLEVYGGDAIVARSGVISVIDVNAWPSFALFRAQAARHISALLAARFTPAGVRIGASR